MRGRSIRCMSSRTQSATRSRPIPLPAAAATVLSCFLPMSRLLQSVNAREPIAVLSSPCPGGLISQTQQLVRHLLVRSQVLSLLEMRMQSVLCIKQVSRLRAFPVAPLMWLLFAPSIHSRRSCPTERLRGRALTLGGYLLRPLLRVAFRSRPRRRRKAKHKPRANDASLQDWEEE